MSKLPVALLELVGAGLIVYGFWLVWIPLAFVLGGLGLIGIALTLEKI